jgi:hypothetical protein
MASVTVLCGCAFAQCSSIEYLNTATPGDPRGGLGHRGQIIGTLVHGWPCEALSAGLWLYLTSPINLHEPTCRRVPALVPFAKPVGEWERGGSRRAQMSEHSSPRPRHQYRRPSCMLFRRDATGRRLARPSFGRVEGAARNSSAVLSCSGGGSAARGPRRERFGRYGTLSGRAEWPWLVRGIFFCPSPRTSRKWLTLCLRDPTTSHGHRKTSPRCNAKKRRRTANGAVTITAQRAFLTISQTIYGTTG